MTQENMGGWMEYAREYAKIQREMGIERWVCITIEYRTKERERVILFRYDLPRDIYERRQWVVRWRHARLLCRYPRENVQTFFSYYDRRTGLDMNFGSALSKLSAAKAQITIARRKEQEYLEYQRQNNMFFNEAEDETLAKFRWKLQSKIEKYAELEREVMLSVQNARSQS
ncbi:hypothetical protein [uncultured Bacteroides sp.]|uniref:hypothetical protein n=1 Tax=uncultured Bacteroides sp. TaxID=162156 RepID=UPI00266EF61A|nr:hypothetical protein [uncultured Bacteroides sp.]